MNWLSVLEGKAPIVHLPKGKSRLVDKGVLLPSKYREPKERERELKRQWRYRHRVEHNERNRVWRQGAGKEWIKAYRAARAEMVKAAKRKYAKSAKGRAAALRYRLSEKGKAAQARWREKRKGNRKAEYPAAKKWRDENRERRRASNRASYAKRMQDPEYAAKKREYTRERMRAYRARKRQEAKT